MTNITEMKNQKLKLDVINLDKYKEIGDSWSKARELEDNRIISKIKPEDIYNEVDKLDDYKDKALFILAYFTAGRISEIVKYQKIIWGKKQVIIIKEGKKPQRKWIQDWNKKIKIGELQDGILKKDITLEKIKGIKCIVIRLRNLKNKNKDSKVKILPVKLNNEVNKKLFKILEIYLNTIPFEHQELFQFGIRNAERIINKVNYNPHSLRKIRLTHLARYEKYSDQQLKLYAGWSDSRPASKYIKLSYEDLV